MYKFTSNYMYTCILGELGRIRVKLVQDLHLSTSGPIIAWNVLDQLNIYIYILKQVTEKAFHKKAKTCRAGFHKKPTKQDGTHMTIRSQITIPTSIFPTTHTIIPYSLFWNVCVYLCVVNSRTGLWVGVCIEGSRE